MWFDKYFQNKNCDNFELNRDLFNNSVSPQITSAEEKQLSGKIKQHEIGKILDFNKKNDYSLVYN